VTDLLSHPSDAIVKAGGTSGAPVKQLILRLTRYLANDPRSILDVGAGKGELLKILSEHYSDAILSGIDVLPQPNDFSRAHWHIMDLNKPHEEPGSFDLVICSEVIEHVENPRQLFRFLVSCTKENGFIAITTPNQRSLRSLLSVILCEHFVAFRESCYPAHITALLKKDLMRISAENGLNHVKTLYTNRGGLPGFPRMSWQAVSFDLLKGNWFSDNIGLLFHRSPAI